MKKIFTIAAVMLFAATTMWAETTIYDFTGKTADSSPTISSTSHHKAGNSKDVYVVTEGEGKDKFCFQVVGSSNGFFYSTTNLSQTKGDRYFSIIDLKAGDKITISYSSTAAGTSSGDFTIANSGTSSSTNLSLSLGGTAIEAGTKVVSGTAYYVLADGYVDFLTKKNFYMTQVTIDPFDPSAKVALSGEWSAADYNLNEDASAKLPTFAVSGGEAELGTDYSVAYSVVEDDKSMVTLDAANGITAINTAAADTATVRATVTLLNEEDYTLAVTEYNCVITVVKPTCAAPVITFKGYNYEQGKYEFSATCATEGATLQFRKKGDAEYTSCTDGESFFVEEGTGVENDKVIVKATKKDYNEKATTTSYNLNAAPAATSPETLIPFLLGHDDSFKNHAYAYRSVTIGEENNASSIGGTVDASTLKLRTNQNGNTLTLYVHEGYKVTNVTINGKTNSTDATKVVKVAALAVDGEEVAEWTGKDAVFPVSSADAVACSTGTIAAGSTIKFTFKAGGTGSMHTQLIASIVVTYENGPATAIENIENANKAVKFMENGQLFILRDGKVFNITGARVK